MNDRIVKLIKSIADENLATVSAQAAGAMTESRAKALLLAVNAIDEPTLNDFYRMMTNHKVMRVAVADLWESSSYPPVAQPATVVAAEPMWLAAALAAYANKLEYAVEDLDPSSPPSQFSPAGQIVHQTAAWVRRQVSRAPIDREKGARLLAYSAPASIPPEATTAQPMMPAQRPTVPVRHFEYNEPIAIDPDEPVTPASPVVRGEEIAISAEDLTTPEDEIRILGDSRSVPPLPGVPVPPSMRPSRISQAANRASDYVRENVTRENVQAATQRVMQGTEQVFNTIRESVASNEGGEIGRTRLRIHVMDYPNGHGLPGVQVMVRYTGSRKEVAGATAADGEFIVSLPAKRGAGITYEATVHWPAEFGNKREKKRITVNPDRSEFALAFYSRLVP